jgi:hypothetical protein
MPMMKVTRAGRLVGNHAQSDTRLQKNQQILKYLIG